jgi:hypothetical protein
MLVQIQFYFIKVENRFGFTWGVFEFLHNVLFLKLFRIFTLCSPLKIIFFIFSILIEMIKILFWSDDFLFIKWGNWMKLVKWTFSKYLNLIKKRFIIWIKNKMKNQVRKRKNVKISWSSRLKRFNNILYFQWTEILSLYNLKLKINISE